MKGIFAAAAIAATAFAATAGGAQAQSPARMVHVEGELVDAWCSITGIMFAQGTAHHQCAVWCAIGGIPVAIRDSDGAHYLILRIEEEEANASSPRIAKILSHQVSVDGELVERDGVKYLLVAKVADDKGVVNA